MIPVSRRFLAALLLFPSWALAHSAILDCFNDGDGRITCEGGFSDGASAAGLSVKVFDSGDKLLLSATLDQEGRLSFARPPGDFRIVLDAGPGHSITLLGSDITD